MSDVAGTEARELELVGKVEFRIALAKDENLESILKVYLPPLLLKLRSEHETVRNKVISTCQHIKIRLSGNEAITLPVAALLTQYKEHSDSSMMRHFDLLFIQQSIGKLSPSEKADLLPLFLRGISKDAGKLGCDFFFNLFLRLLSRLPLPARDSKEDANFRAKLGFDERTEDTEFILFWLGKAILLSIMKQNSATIPLTSSPPGLTPEEYDFLTLNRKLDTWDPTSREGLNLTDTKISILSFLASGAFTDDERFIPVFFAAADSNSRISSIGEDILKRNSPSMENGAAINKLFGIYETLKPALKTRILTLFSKSVVATTFPDHIITVVRGGILNDEDTSIKGLEASKLRNALLHFINWVARMGSNNNLQQVAPPLITLLKDFIEKQGWPTPHDPSTDQESLRALAYETIGTLAKAIPSRIREPELSLVKWLFKSFTRDDSSDATVLSIEAALANIMTVFVQPLDFTLNHALRILLLRYVMDEDGNIIRTARFPAVRWANRCLEYSDILGRRIDIFAIGGRSDERQEVVEEGQKGLDPYWYRLVNSSSTNSTFQLPEWSRLVENLFTEMDYLGTPTNIRLTEHGPNINRSVWGKFCDSNINAFSCAVSYCRRVLLLLALGDAKSSISNSVDWERKLDISFQTDKSFRDATRCQMMSIDNKMLSIFFTAAFEGMRWNNGGGLEECGKSFVELGSLAPRESLEALASRAKELLPAIWSNNSTTRSFAAQAYGILASHPENDGRYIYEYTKLHLEAIENWNSAVGFEANKVHGSILALGYLLSRLAYCGRLDIEETLAQSAVSQILDILMKSKDPINMEAVLNTVGQLSSSGILTETRIKMSPYSIDDVIKIVTSQAKTGNQRGIAAFGRLAMLFDEGPDGYFMTILSSLYELYELRQFDALIAVGEALVCAVACWESDLLPLSLDVDAHYDGLKKRSSALSSVIDKLLADSKKTKPSLKRASAIWLFCVIQYCGHLEEVRSRLRECQATFIVLLSARDDLVQETGSRGLCLVYEQGSKDLKERLVQDLVASFTGVGSQLKVDQDTELFEPGALPTESGQSVISYKDIVSLAAEVGDQSLVYKFMHLASNAATWSSRAAFGRFGLSNILSDSTIDPKLYPKLYRYRFDPNPNVQRSMKDIWTALVTNPTAIINEHFDAILSDLLKNIMGREWRARQASCAAIGDLIQGRPFETYKKYLSQIWDVSYRVLDDIKDSVRKAAASLCRILAGLLIRMLEEGTSPGNAQAALKDIMPFLFSTRGLESSAPEVQKFAHDTLLKLIKSGGVNLIPFIPGIVEHILGLLSTLEPDFINFVHINAAKFDTTAEEIDDMRSRIISRSPMMEAVERCLDLMDEPAMASLVPRLQNVIKTSVGMPSKVGCSGVLISLAARHSFLFRPHADILLKAIERAVLDRNSTVSAAYARAAGYVSRLVSDTQLLKFTAYSRNLYLSAEDETRRQVSADIIYAVSRFAPDRFHSMAVEFLPFVFMAKHDTDNDVQDHFGKVWDENVGGSRTVLLYLNEITTLSSECLDSPKWAIKHTAALAIADVVTSSGVDINPANAEMVWRALEKALALKTFDGKERVLQAYVKFSRSAKDLWVRNPSVATEMKKIAVREAKRKNLAYHPHALTCLGEYAQIRTDIDMFDDVFDIVSPRLEESAGEEPTDAIITAGIMAIFRAINVSQVTPSPLTRLPALLAVLQRLRITAPTQAAVYESMSALFSNLRGCIVTPSDYSMALAFFSLLALPSNAGGEGLRTKRAEAAESLVVAMAGGVFGTSSGEREDVKRRMLQEIQAAKRNERSDFVRNVLERAERGLHYS